MKHVKKTSKRPGLENWVVDHPEFIDMARRLDRLHSKELRTGLAFGALAEHCLKRYRENDGWHIRPLDIRYNATNDEGEAHSEIVITDYDVSEARESRRTPTRGGGTKKPPDHNNGTTAPVIRIEECKSARGGRR